MTRWEPHARVPARAFRATTAHELTFAQHGLLTWVIEKCRGTGEAAATLRSLSDEVRWPYSLERLRQDLHTLDDRGWIAAEPPTAGGKKPWRFLLCSAQIGLLGLEVTSNRNGASDAQSQHSSGSSAKRPPSGEAPELKGKETEKGCPSCGIGGGMHAADCEAAR
jgi:hypothetical protein